MPLQAKRPLSRATKAYRGTFPCGSCGSSVAVTIAVAHNRYLASSSRNGTKETFSVQLEIRAQRRTRRYDTGVISKASTCRGQVDEQKTWIAKMIDNITSGINHVKHVALSHCHFDRWIVLCQWLTLIRGFRLIRAPFSRSITTLSTRGALPSHLQTTL